MAMLQSKLTVNTDASISIIRHLVFEEEVQARIASWD